TTPETAARSRGVAGGHPFEGLKGARDRRVIDAHGGRETAVLRKILTAGLLMMITAGHADAAEIRALISNGLHTTVAELAPQFEAATGHKLAIRYDTAAFLQRDIERGVDFDVTVITGTNFDAIAKAGKLDLATRTEVVRSGIGVAVRQGAPKPDIGTV